MSTLIKNIALLDARKATPEQIRGIGRICNIGCLLVSGENKAEFFRINILNVGKMLELEDSYKLHVGPLEINKKYLEDSSGEIRICVVGPLTISNDVTPELLIAKLTGIYLIGPAMLPQNLHGTFMNLAKEVIGPVIAEPESGLKTRGKVKIDNDYLNALDDGVDLSVDGKVTFADDVNPELLTRKLASLRVDGEIHYQSELGGDLEKILVKTDRTRVKIHRFDYHYVPGGSIMDNFTLMTLGNKTVSCHGILILDKEVTPEVIRERNVKFEAGIVYFPKDLIKDMISRLAPGTKGIPYEPNTLEIIPCEQLMTPSRLEMIEKRRDMIVMVELDFDDAVSVEAINEKLGHIDNYGIIRANRELASIIQGKLRQNEGVIQIKGEEDDDACDRGEFDNVIENVATYTL